MFFNVFKITKTTGANPGNDLLGLLVIQTDEGFFLVDPEPSLQVPRLLAAALINSKRPPVGSFGSFHLDNSRFTLDIDTISGTEIHGRWFPGIPTYGSVDDTWTATGTGIGAGGEDEARAASAK